MNLIDTIRLRHGLRWIGSTPGLSELRNATAAILSAAAILAAYSAADAIQTATDRAIAAEQAADIMEASHTVLKNCERGAVGYYYADGRTFECGKEL